MKLKYMSTSKGGVGGGNGICWQNVIKHKMRLKKKTKTCEQGALCKT